MVKWSKVNMETITWGFASRVSRVYLSFWIVFGALLSVGGCTNKGFIKPRSQVIEEAKSNGVAVPSIAEERELFFADEELQRKRLMTLIQVRSSMGFRDANYRLGAGDEIEVNVFDVPELNVTARIRQSGFVALPLVGAVKAAGLTESELHEELTGRLSTYVRDPQVNVFISQFGSQKVAVMGAVRTPGTYSLKKGANSILELISEAGGVNDKAGNFINFIPSELSGVGGGNDIEGRARLALVASEGVQAKNGGIQIYLDQILGTSGGIPLEIPVHGGDMVIVPEAGKIMVEGEVDRSGSYDLNQQTTLLSALASAGGITYSAKTDEVEIIREVSAEKKARLVLDLAKIANGEERDVRLKNGDIVQVPSDSGRRMTRDTFEGLSRIINFGIGGSVRVGP